MNYIKATINFCVIVLFLSSAASASINTDMRKFDSANEKTFAKLDKQAAIDFKTLSTQKNVNILVISNSANFENCNLVFSYKVINSKDVEIIDAKERVSTVSFNELSKYSNHFFTGKAPKSLDTSGSLSDNSKTMKITANQNPTFEAITDYDFSEKELSSEFKLVSQVVKHDSYWKGLLISDSANFENSNQFVGYHIVNSNEIKIYQETGEISTTSFKELSKYECHFFSNGLPKKIDTSGKLSGNLEIIKQIQKYRDSKRK